MDLTLFRHEVELVDYNTLLGQMLHQLEVFEQMAQTSLSTFYWPWTSCTGAETAGLSLNRPGERCNSFTDA